MSFSRPSSRSSSNTSLTLGLDANPFSSENTDPTSFPPPPPPEKVPTIQVLNNELSLCSKEDFFQFFQKSGVSPNDKFLVVSITGSYAAGKSTLMNYLFFNKVNVFDNLNREGIKGLTNGMHMAVVKFKTEKKEVNLLLIDSEGLAGPKENALDFGALLSLRLLVISDVIIHNSANVLLSNAFQHIKQASYRLFQRDHKKDVKLIFFVQRANLNYHNINDIAHFFPDQSIPEWFPKFQLAYSRDNIPGDEEHIRLNLDGLKKELDATLAQAPSTTPQDLWSSLFHLDENLPKPNPDQQIDESFDSCKSICFYCHRRCVHDRYFQHQHEDPNSQCNGDKNIAYKCRQCSTENQNIRYANADCTFITPMFWLGPLWYCNNPTIQLRHGPLAHQYTWKLWPPFVFESEQFKTNVTKRKEHHFSTEPLPEPSSISWALATFPFLKDFLPYLPNSLKNSVGAQGSIARQTVHPQIRPPNLLMPNLNSNGTNPLSAVPPRITNPSTQSPDTPRPSTFSPAPTPSLAPSSSSSPSSSSQSLPFEITRHQTSIQINTRHLEGTHAPSVVSAISSITATSFSTVFRFFSAI